MSDEQTPDATPAPEAPQTGQPQGGEKSSPATQEHSDPQPNPQIERLTNQVNGMKGYVDPLVKGGIRSPEEVESLLQARQQLEALQKRGINIESLIGNGGQQPAQQVSAEKAPLTRDDLSAFFAEQKFRDQHEAQEATATRNLEQMAKDLGGESSDLIMDLATQEARRYISEHGERYPPDHPLYETNYKPLTDRDISQIRDRVQKKIDAYRGLKAREQIDSPGSMDRGGQMDGAATDPSTSGLSDKEQRKARVSSLFERNLAASQGETISNA